MNQKIFNNIILLFIILYIIINVSPHPDSILYVLQKHLNYLIFKIKYMLTNMNFENFNNITFTGIAKYHDKTPSFKTSHEVVYVKYFNKLHPDIDEKIIYNLYYFIKKLVSIDTDTFFNTPSDVIPNDFNENEILKLQSIILKKLNHGNQFSFYEFNFELIPKYYLNINGKELDPFIFNVKSNIGDIRIYIDVNIRNDVYENKEYIVINDIKPITDNNVISLNQNIVHDVKNKTKPKKTPFMGDPDLIFTNNSIDDYDYNDIEIEKLNIVDNLNYDNNDNLSHKSQEQLYTVNNDLFAYNEYDNLDFIKDNSDFSKDNSDFIKNTQSYA